MMKAKKILIPVILLLMALASCKQEAYYLFNDVARIQFGPDITRIYTASFNLADTTKNFTFFYNAASETQDTVFFDIYTIGGPSTKDRSFGLRQVTIPGSVLNAVAGTDYKTFTDASVNKHYVIKAGQVHALVPIVMLRNPALKTTTVTLKFEVIENENFKPGEISTLWRKVIFTDRLSQPTAWTASMGQYYYGAYSTAKHAFMIQISGQRWDQEFMTIVSADQGLLKYYTSSFKHALADYNNAHPGNPMKDENGLVIVFP